MSEELPRYTAENLEAWAVALSGFAEWERQVWETGDAPSGDEETARAWVEGAENAARFLEDTAATLRSQAKLRRERAARSIIEKRKTRRRGRRR